MNKFVQFAAAGLLTLASYVICIASAHADEREFVEGEGVVQEVSIGEGTVVISGFIYQVEAHADVSVRGAPSSIAALAADMKVIFRYESREDRNDGIAGLQEPNLIFQIEQLPDSTPAWEF